MGGEGFNLGIIELAVFVLGNYIVFSKTHGAVAFVEALHRFDAAVLTRTDYLAQVSLNLAVLSAETFLALTSVIIQIGVRLRAQAVARLTRARAGSVAIL